MRRRDEEAQPQPAIVQLLTYAAVPGVLWWHSPNGELRTGRTGAILAGMGVRPGVSDFTLVLPPHGQMAALELKSRTGRLSEAQQEFGAACLAVGALHGMARTIDEAIAVLSAWRAVRIGGRGRAA
ncbi:MAG TPA: hypothetical protein VGI22_04340 [Xanthobacteraceae bacterium]